MNTDSTTNLGSEDLKVDRPPEKSFLSPDYNYAKDRIEKLIRSWDLEFKNTDYRRRVRDIKVSVSDLRTQGKLKPDETIIPIRLIDTNIKREEAPKIAYLKQSRRLAIFKPKNRAKTLNVQTLEEEFTRVSQYPGWELDYMKVMDGAATHGWDSIEICFEPDLPGKFCVDHIGHENLLFPLDCKNIEANEFILRARQLTCSQLRKFAQKFGFDKEQVDKVLQSTQRVRQSTNFNTQAVPIEDSQREIYKVFFKENGVVYVGWYGADCTDWLKKPAKLFMGKRKQVPVVKEQQVPMETGKTPWGDPVVQDVPIPVTTLEWQDVDETAYPVKILPYEENEKTRIQDKKGRVDKDDYKQEALIAVWSSFVNSCIRASNVHASPRNGGSGAAPKQTSVIIEHGKMWNEPIDFFNTPWPDPMILNAAQALDIQNTQETLQLSAAVNNRKDSRKTAKEIEKTSQEQSLIGGVQVTLISIFLRETLNAIWEIVQSQALQKLIVFCMQEVASEIYEVNTQLVGEEFDIFAAGDVDVVERQEKVSLMLQTYPMYANTPLGMEFLIELTKLLFPENAEKFEKILRVGFAQQQMQMQMMAAMGAQQNGMGQEQPKSEVAA